MRWKLKPDPHSDELIEVEILSISDHSYHFRVGSEELRLSEPQVFPYSIKTKELKVSLEAWQKKHWRAVVGSKTYEVERIPWDQDEYQKGGAIQAKMPGRVTRVFVQEGDEVKRGQTLLIMEAMKMENEIRSETDGQVANLHIEAGQSIESGASLIEIKTASDLET